MNIVGVDFDGTLVEHQYPRIGPEVAGAFEWLHRLQGAGVRLMLWTMRDNQTLTEAVVYCASRGIDVIVPRGQLYAYVTAAEDTIEAQGAMLCADLTDFTRLRTENTTLRKLVEAALTAAQLNDPTALTIIREALERTT